MIANAGHLRIADPELAARQFLALISAEMPELTHMGTHAPTDRDHRAAVLRGVATFAAAHARD